jgi:DNA gyrase/topoisomerase IV subunit A
MRRAGARAQPPVSSSGVAVGEPLIAISQLPRELQEPLRAFRRRGVKYLTADELRRVFDECSRLAEGRTRLYERETELLKARTSHDLAVAAAKFVATLTEEQRAILQMRIEAQARLDFDRLRAENAQLATEVARYRALPRPGRN